MTTTTLPICLLQTWEGPKTFSEPGKQKNGEVGWSSREEISWVLEQSLYLTNEGQTHRIL